MTLLELRWRIEFQRRSQLAMLWIVKRLPRGLRYWCVVQAICEATSGQWSDTVVPELAAMDVLSRIGGSK